MLTRGGDKKKEKGQKRGGKEKEPKFWLSLDVSHFDDVSIIILNNNNNNKEEEEEEEEEHNDSTRPLLLLLL